MNIEHRTSNARHRMERRTDNAGCPVTPDGVPARDSAGFEEVDHTADVALHLWAPDFETLLVQAARGAAWLMSEQGVHGPFPVRKRMILEASDREELLVEWLSELAFSAETDRELFYEFEFESVADCRLIAIAKGKRVRTLKTVIKAVTYHNLNIVTSDRGLDATVVFDV